MQYARKLRKGDKVAIVSLSSGMLGEEFCSHNIEIGVKRLKEYGLKPVFMPNALKGIEYLQAHPEARAKDLKDAFLDDSIAGIICAIGGDDTYRLLPYLMEDEEFIKAVKKHPKLFTGFSDTTVNHLMFYKLGLSTYYGPNFICDLGEIADEMLPYTKRAFEGYLEGNESDEIISSEIWYEEREDFSRAAMGTDRIPHKEEWQGKILFIETCEEKPVPELFEKEIMLLKEKGIFDVINGVLVGKPQDETYYQEYKDILIKVIDNEELPIVYNVNFGHATPRCALQYGVIAKVDMKRKKISDVRKKAEIWDLYNENRELIGKDHVRGEQLPIDGYHLVVHVWIRNSNGEYLISQRSANRPTYPLMWECVGGSVIKGEDSLRGAIREVKEEVGVDLTPENGQVLFSKTRKIIDGKVFNDIMDVWLFDYDGEVDLGNATTDEVEQVAWMTREQIKELFEQKMFVGTLEYFFTEVDRQ